MKYIYLLLAWFMCFNVYSQANPCISLVDGKFFDPSTNQQFVSKGVNLPLDICSFDNGVTFELKPHHAYKINNVNTCSGQINCETEISNYFQYLKNTLGINTLRIPVFEPYPNNQDCNSSTYFVPYTDANGNAQSIQSTDLSAVASAYTKILNIAQSNGLKVMLLLAGKGSECDNPIIKTIYDNYLVATAQACNNHPALLAYDLWNEPELQKTVTHKKAEICISSNLRYNLLKTHDPNHLITIGIWSVDAWEYSPDVFKADFFSVHIYSSYRTISHEEILVDQGGNPVLDQNGLPIKYVVLDQNIDYNNVQRYVESFNMQLKWITNNYNIPFLIGETGFRARRDILPPYTTDDNRMDGDLNAQSQFINQTYASTINSGGLGYIWWQAYDVYWNPPYNPGGDDFGLIDPDQTTQSYIPKPAATTFKNFNQYQATGPAVTYPPNYTNFEAYTGTAFHGTVTNDLGEQVKDAVIGGWHLQPNIQNANNTDYTNYSQTFTLPNGSFVLNSITPDPNGGSILSTQINLIRASAVFHNNLECYRYDPVNGDLPISHCDNITYQLTKQQLTDVTLNNQILFNGYQNNYSASNNLTFNNSFIDLVVGPQNPQLKSTFIAGREIAITGESHISGPYDNEFYINFNPDCSDNTYSLRQANSNTKNKNYKNVNTSLVENQVAESKIKTVYLNYDNSITNNAVLVYPNPVNNGNINIQSDIGITNVSLINSMGQHVFNQSVNQILQKNTVNLTNLIGGLYLLHITLPNGNKSIHQLIIE
jgi:hypothetical protein